MTGGGGGIMGEGGGRLGREGGGERTTGGGERSTCRQQNTYQLSTLKVHILMHMKPFAM